MPLDPRVDGHRRSLEALHALLAEMCANPQAFATDIELRAAVTSQGALARFERGEKGIAAGSINTHKRHGNVILGGFDALDKLRKRAKALSEVQADRPKRAYGTRAALEESVKELERQLNTLRADLLIGTQVLSLALRHSRSYAADAGPDVAARCQREQRELLAYLAARSISPETSVAT